MPKISEKSRAKYQSLLRGGSPQPPEKHPVSTETTSSSKRRRIDVEESNIGGNDTRELLEKIYRQNSQMAAKLDEILAKHKALEERMDRMEVDLEESNIDEAFANVIKFYIYITKLVYLLIFFNGIIKNVAKNIFTNSIYPTKTEIRDATEAYMVDNHAEYFENLSEKRWTVFYDKKIEKGVCIENLTLFI
jgi:hypothetical protein